MSRRQVFIRCAVAGLLMGVMLGLVDTTHATANVQMSQDAVNAQQGGSIARLESDVKGLIAVNAGSRLAVLEDNITEMKFLQRTVIAGMVAQILMGVFAARKLRKDEDA